MPVDQQKFAEAQQAYDAADFRTAAKLFLSSAGKGPDGNGAAYHMAGNALMRLRRYADAVTVYGHALRDGAYERHGAVQANLGTAYAALGEYSEAAVAYEAALADPGYPTPYKAYQGMASALMERQRVEEAAVAYRKAALDEGNPDPGKALVNLGLCFMALRRPADAAEAYKAALGFDTYQGRGKALSNLGMAYVAMGEHDEAVRAFEKATELHGYQLPASAQAAYEAALEATRPTTKTIEGWETGEMPAIEMGEAPGGWDTTELMALTGAAAGVGVTYADAGPAEDPGVAGDPIDADVAAAAAAALGFGDDTAVNDFFSMTEEQMKVRDREARKAQRQTRGSGGWIRTAVIAAIVVLLAGAALGALYWFGFGWPTQQATVEGLLVAYGKGEAVEKYWVAVPEKDVAKEMAKVPPVKEYTVDAVNRDTGTSTVSVTVTPEKGAPLHYTVTLQREGVGWKVTGVENEWRSTGG